MLHFSIIIEKTKNFKKGHKMASYYKKINGKSYDRGLLDLADGSIKGKGDGRISINDAKKLFKKIKDSNEYTDIEKRTVQYIRDNYQFTKEADSYFRAEVRKWASGKKESVKKTAPPQKKAAVKKKGVKKPSLKKKAAKKPAVKKAAAKKPAVKKAAAKRPVIKKTEVMKKETGFVPSQREPGFREAEAVQSAAAVSEVKREGSKKPVFTGVIIVILAVLAFLFAPRIKKYISGKREAPVRETAPGKGEVSEVNKSGEMKKEAAESGKSKEFPVPAGEEKNIYTVKVKDQLTEISYKFYGNYKDWKIIYNANRERIKEPALIFPGQKLMIPEKK